MTFNLSARENQRDSFYSESDSDSDVEEKTRKIHVEIKPATVDGSVQNLATVEDIKASLGNLTLSPPIVSNIIWMDGSLCLGTNPNYPKNWIFIEFSPPLLRFLQAWGEIGPLKFGYLRYWLYC